MLDISFYKGKKILITGHTGFKGAWLCQMLLNAGAEVTGYALQPNTNPSLYELIHLEERMNSVIGDIRDFETLEKVFDRVEPEIVFHLAAQPIVRESYKNPRYTYETNIMGTVNILECIRQSNCVKSFVNVTTDKVYRNNERGSGFIESDELNGYDPYSNSKSCSELVTYSYVNSFLKEKNIAVSTARAGNVVGGGDFAINRIIPDCVRAALNQEKIIVRNPYSIRPYQHVLEALGAYLLIAQKQYENPIYADCYNVGPDDNNCFRTGDIAELFVNTWGNGIEWINQSDKGPHEAELLKLNCSKIKSKLGWKPCWNMRETMELIVDWTKCWDNGGDLVTCVNEQIKTYLKRVQGEA